MGTTGPLAHQTLSERTSLKLNKNRLKKDDLLICHFNCQGLASEERLVELETALTERQIDIIGISEIKRKGEQIIQRKNGNMFYYFGSTKGYRGVGFYINKRILNQIVEIKGISERIALLKIHYNKETITIIQVYGPTLSAPVEEIKEFYNSLDNCFATEKSLINIVMGDFNAKIGKSDRINLGVGPELIGESNKNGAKLITFSNKNNLKIANTFFRKKANKRWTWASPDGLTRNEIDHLLTDNLGMVIDVKPISNFHFSSDHRPIVCKIRLAPRRYQKLVKANLIGKMIPVHKRQEAENLLGNCLSQVDWKELKADNLQDRYNFLEGAIKNTIEELGTPKKLIRTDDKLSKETKDLIQKRTLIKKKGTLNKKEQIELIEIKKLIKKKIKNDLYNFDQEMAKSIVESTWSTRQVKKALAKGRCLLPKIKNKQGKLIYNRELIAKTVTEYYQDLYADTGMKLNIPSTSDGYQDNQLGAPKVKAREVLEVIRSLKANSAPGPDEIENETLKMFKGLLATPLAALFNCALSSGLSPTQWHLSEIILIHKSGDRAEINNYRPISLSSNICKIFMKILKHKIYNILDTQQPVEQAGFRKNFSTIDHIQTLSQILEKSKEFQIKLAIMFVDFNKAFDSLYHEVIWSTLEKQGVPQKIINILSEIYYNSVAKIKIENWGEKFNVKRGVKQGDPLSPYIFNAVLEEVFRNLNWRGKGLKISGQNFKFGENKYLNNLRFADDIVIIAKSNDELKAMAEDLRRESRKVGLTINLAKTKIMTNINQFDAIQIENNKIEIVPEYKYLGQTMSLINRTKNELKVRKAKAWKAFWAQKTILKGKMALKTKIKILESTVYPVLTYGAQTWACTVNQIQKLGTTQHSMLRNILGIRLKDKTSNSEIFSKTKTKNLIMVIKKLKLKYAGHVARESKYKWNKLATFWIPSNGKRKQGRPSKRWADELVAVAGPNWKNEAQDRRKWAALTEKAYTQELGKLSEVRGGDTSTNQST